MSFNGCFQEAWTLSLHMSIFILVLVAPKRKIGLKCCCVCTYAGVSVADESELIEVSPGDVAGIKSATIKFTGDYAFWLVAHRTGVHRLVRKSPFDSVIAVIRPSHRCLFRRKSMIIFTLILILPIYASIPIVPVGLGAACEPNRFSGAYYTFLPM